MISVRRGVGGAVGALLGADVGVNVVGVGAIVGDVGAMVGDVGASVGSVGEAVGDVGAIVGDVGASVGLVGEAVGATQVADPASDDVPLAQSSHTIAGVVPIENVPPLHNAQIAWAGAGWKRPASHSAQPADSVSAPVAMLMPCFPAMHDLQPVRGVVAVTASS